MTLSDTLIGGPTALLEIDGFRVLTDPIFDAPGAYRLLRVTLEKLSGPALKPEADLRASFDTIGFGSRGKLLEPGVATVIEPPHHP